MKNLTAKLILPILLFATCVSATAQATASTASKAGGKPTPSPAVNFNQITMELSVPGISPNVRMTVADQIEIIFRTKSLSNAGGSQSATGWSVLPSVTLQKDGSFALRAEAFLGSEGTAKKDVVEKSLTLAEAAKGIPIGQVTIKLTQKIATGNLPPIADVWLLVASRKSATNPKFKDVPAIALSQAATALGFKPGIIFAQIIDSSKDQIIGVALPGETLQISLPILTKGSTAGESAQSDTTLHNNHPVFSATLESLTDNKAMRKQLNGGGDGWVGAPILLGPVQNGSDETYVILVATGKSSSAGK